MLLSPLFFYSLTQRTLPRSSLSLSLYFSILNVELVKRTHIWKEDGKINPLKGDWTGSVTRSIHRGQGPFEPIAFFSKSLETWWIFWKVFYIAGSCLHCNKTLRRIPPPWLDVAGPYGQKRELLTHRPMLVFYIPPLRKTFLEFSRDLPGEKKKECGQEGWTHVLRICFYLLLVLILSYTPRPRLPCKRVQNMKY